MAYVVTRLKSSKKKVSNHDPEHYPSKEKMLRVLQLSFGDLSQSEKLSEIKPPLVTLEVIEFLLRGVKIIICIIPIKRPGYTSSQSTPQPAPKAEVNNLGWP